MITVNQTTPGHYELQVGEISFLNDKSVRIGHNDHLFINGCDVSGFKIGDRVNAKVIGNKLSSIEHKAEEQHPAEMKSGGGKISVIDLDKPFFEYSYLYQGAPASSKFYHISDAAKAQLAQYHIGDEISATWTVDDKKRTLQGVGPKQVSSGGGWRKPFDPVAAAKKEAFEERKQQMIVRQSSLDRAVELWISTKPANQQNCTENDLKTILDVADRFVEWVMK